MVFPLSGTTDNLLRLQLFESCDPLVRCGRHLPVRMEYARNLMHKLIFRSVSSAIPGVSTSNVVCKLIGISLAPYNTFEEYDLGHLP